MGVKLENSVTETCLRNLPKWGQFVRFSETVYMDKTVHKSVDWAWDPGSGRSIRVASFDRETGQYLGEVIAQDSENANV